MKPLENNNTSATTPISSSAPVLFIIFNSPETTAQVFERIKAAQPARLFIAADGPRADKAGEKERCEAVRKIVADINWPCDVSRKYSDVNQGCRLGVSSAITWFFEHVDEGIILEDDCLPDPTFFAFCTELLERYRNNASIKMISGSNFQFGKTPVSASYFFSNFPQIWGWATWKRAWQEYDITMSTYPDFKKNNTIATITKDPLVQKHWLHIFNMLYNTTNKIDTWDGQWAYSIFSHGGISIIPAQNLISNIGYGADATHTTRKNIFSNISTVPMTAITHPTTIEINEKADAFYSSLIIKNIFQKVLSKLQSLWSN